ncbi:serpin family protein [Nocardioides islandensis]|uniref:Serpin family protein n=1 Tax=Nocardioides islandensis TaxID=433663 RepID=A0A930YET7_9ACTN|nr:serpin family protein [Nocardioides islandensis]MBF4764098.1 serpin family protein [Nocardioides islandensis]
MPTRRDVLRLIGLAALATSVSSLAACGGDRTSHAEDVDLVSSDVERTPGDPAVIAPVVAVMHRLGGGLYGGLAGTPGNLALSPYSVAVALAMTANGAVGATAGEMAHVLGLDIADLDLAAYNGGLGALTQAVEALAITEERPGDEPAVIKLDSANALFGDKATPWRPAYLDTLAASYGAGMRVVDWAGATEAGRVAVNAWTAEQTHDRIPEILPPGSVDALTKLVLVNALYFKAPWQTTFEEHATADLPFHVDGGDPVDVPTMRGTLMGAGYAEVDGCRVVRLPYYGGTLAMTVLLPEDLASFEEQQVAPGNLATYIANVSSTAVSLSLPKWTFRPASDLAEVLGALGMPTAFDPSAADFSGMTEDADGLCITDVAHQAWIAVDEAGTEAAAATAVAVGGTSMPETVPLVVDRPFLFVIHDVEHGTPLFVGRVTDPRG